MQPGTPPGADGGVSLAPDAGSLGPDGGSLDLDGGVSLAPDGGPTGTGTLPDILVLASGEQGPRQVALDATHVFWGTSIQDNCCAEVRMVPKAGGTPATLFSAPRNLDLPGGVNHQAAVLHLSVDADWIFAEVQENEVIPTTDGPDRHFTETFWRIARADGTAQTVALPQGYGDVRYDEKNIYLLKAPVDSKNRDLELAVVAKATGASTVATFHPSDPLFSHVGSFAVDGGILYLSYDNYYGAPQAHCVARAPITGGALEDFWCPAFELHALVAGADSLFGYNGTGPRPGFWMVGKGTGSARAIADGSPNGWISAVDERSGMLFGTESTFDPMDTELFRIDLATGARLRVDSLRGYHAPVQLELDAGRIFYARGNEILSVKR